MKFNVTIAGSPSGSLGAITASHNAFGSYLRKRVVPVNPNTSNQIAVRNFLASLTALWGALSQANRDLWINYAANTPKTDALGAVIHPTGLNWYVACNSLRLQASITRVDPGPTTFGLAAMTAPSAGVTTSTNISVAFTSTALTDEWARNVGGALLVYMSAPFSPTHVFFNGPYRFAGKILGAVTPPTSPQLVTKPYAVAIGQKVGFKFVCVNADGRISSPIRQIYTVVA